MFARMLALLLGLISAVPALAVSGTELELRGSFTARDWTKVKQPMMPLPTPDWRLAFADEFTASTLDRSVWTTCYWWNNNGCTNSGNKELQWYRPENVQIADGVLRLVARRGDQVGHEGQIFPYSSGIVTTGRDYEELPRPSRVMFTHGYFEFRVRPPAGKGLWSALWLLPNSRESRPEIDIMEVLGDSADQHRMHLHVNGPGGKRKSRGNTVTVADQSAGWQTYGLLWTERALIWYLNGQEYWRVEEQAAIPAEPMYILMNLAVGGTWPGAPDAKTQFPAWFEIDYVRVWQRPDSQL